VHLPGGQQLDDDLRRVIAPWVSRLAAPAWIVSWQVGQTTRVLRRGPDQPHPVRITGTSVDDRALGRDVDLFPPVGAAPGVLRADAGVPAELRGADVLDLQALLDGQREELLRSSQDPAGVQQ
jgi:hypothetical protein